MKNMTKPWIIFKVFVYFILIYNEYHFQGETTVSTDICLSSYRFIYIMFLFDFILRHLVVSEIPDSDKDHLSYNLSISFTFIYTIYVF